MIPVKIKRLHPDAIVPEYATYGAGAFDIFSITEGAAIPNFIARTGWSFEIPPGYCMLIFSRSGHGFKHDVRLANCVGVIDSDYRGELMVKLHHDSEWRISHFSVKKGDRIAQGLILPVPVIKLVEVDQLSSTERGENGLGSTGR